MAASVDSADDTITSTKTSNIENWIRETAPLVAFHSNSKGGGFIGKKTLKPILAARARKELGEEEVGAQRFNEAWERLCRKGFIQQLIESGKPKAIPAGSASSTGSPAHANAMAAPSLAKVNGIVADSQPSRYTTTVEDAVSNNNIQSANATKDDIPANTVANSCPPVSSPSTVNGSGSAPMRFGPATGIHQSTPLVTPGGSLTPETAKELAAFGGAVIRRGASAQINITLPPHRERRTTSSSASSASAVVATLTPPNGNSNHTNTASSSSSNTSSNSVHQAEVVNTKVSTKDRSTSPIGSASSRDRQRSWSPVRHSSPSPYMRPPPEPAQPWKSLEVSLVDASLLRGFTPTLASASPVPKFATLATPGSSTNSKPERRNSVALPTPGIRRGTTLPVPPPQPMIYSISSQAHQELHSTPTSAGLLQELREYSHINGNSYTQRPLPSPPHSQSASPVPPPRDATNPPSVPGPYPLSRRPSTVDAHVVYNPPLRLSEISLPYRVQYHILGLLLITLELVFFDFAGKWFPEILQKNSWDCPEAADVTVWSKEILQALENAEGEVTYSNGDSINRKCVEGDLGTQQSLPRPKISRKPPPHALAHLTILLKNVKELHSDTTSRKFISGEKLLGHLDNTIRVSGLLGCNSRVTDLEEVTYYVKEALGGIGIVREAVRKVYNERIERINKKREELERLEKETVEEGNRVEKEECKRLGWDLAEALELRIGNVMWQSGAMQYGKAKAGNAGAWNHTKSRIEEDDDMPIRVSSSKPPFFPPSSSQSLLDDLRDYASVEKPPFDQHQKVKSRASSNHFDHNNNFHHYTNQEPGILDSPLLDRGRPRAPRISRTSTNNTIQTTTNITPTQRSTSSSTIPHQNGHSYNHCHYRPIPQNSSINGAQRPSSALYTSLPSESPTSDYEEDTDNEHDETGGGVGLEVTLSSNGHQNSTITNRPNTTTIPPSHHRKVPRNSSSAVVDQHHSQYHRRPITPTQLNMVREPVPEVPITIAKIIETPPGTEALDETEKLASAMGIRPINNGNMPSTPVTNKPRLTTSISSSSTNTILVTTGSSPIRTSSSRPISTTTPTTSVTTRSRPSSSIFGDYVNAMTATAPTSTSTPPPVPSKSAKRNSLILNVPPPPPPPPQSPTPPLTPKERRLATSSSTTTYYPDTMNFGSFLDVQEGHRSGGLQQTKWGEQERGRDRDKDREIDEETEDEVWAECESTPARRSMIVA